MVKISKNSKASKKELTYLGIKRLISFLSNVKDKDGMEKLLRDLLSPREIREIARRLQAAEMLIEGLTYTDIEEKTEMSPITIHKVSQKLKHGYHGFDLMFGKLRLPGDKVYCNQGNISKRKFDYDNSFSEDKYYKWRLSKGK